MRAMRTWTRPSRAARRAFDETAWSTDKEFRKRCLLQLQAALEEERELLRAELVAEVGTPVLLTYGPQLDAPLAEGLTWPAHFIDEFAWERDLPEGNAFGTRSWRKVDQGGRRASSAPSCRGTTPSRSPSTSSARLWPPATR